MGFLCTVDGVQPVNPDRRAWDPVLRLVGLVAKQFSRTLVSLLYILSG